MTHTTTTIIGTVLVLWTVAVCVWSLWAMGPIRTRRVEKLRGRASAPEAVSGGRDAKPPRLTVLRGGRP